MLAQGLQKSNPAGETYTKFAGRKGVTVFRMSLFPDRSEKKQYWIIILKGHVEDTYRFCIFIKKLNKEHCPKI